MKKIDTYACEECDKQKGDTNHWFIIELFPSQFQINTWGIFTNMDKKIAACSEQCVTKILSKWMSTVQSAPTSHSNLPEPVSHPRSGEYSPLILEK